MLSHSLLAKRNVTNAKFLKREKMMTPDAGLPVLLLKTFLIWVRSLLKERQKNKQKVVDVGAFFNITRKPFPKFSHETKQKKKLVARHPILLLLTFLEYLNRMRKKLTI